MKEEMDQLQKINTLCIHLINQITLSSKLTICKAKGNLTRNTLNLILKSSMTTEEINNYHKTINSNITSPATNLFNINSNKIIKKKLSCTVHHLIKARMKIFQFKGDISLLSRQLLSTANPIPYQPLSKMPLKVLQPRKKGIQGSSNPKKETLHSTMSRTGC